MSRISGGTVWWKSPSTGLARGLVGKPAGPTKRAPGMARSVMTGALKGCFEENGEGTRRPSPGPEQKHRSSLGAKHAMQGSPEQRTEMKLSTGERKRTGK